MAKRSHITVVEGEQETITAEPAEDDASLASPEDEVWQTQDWIEDDDGSPRSNWIAPTLALIAIAAWTSFFLWAFGTSILSGVTPREAVDLVVSWMVPVLLVVALWLLILRRSTREAKRFANVARSLSHEAEALEQRVATINRELSLAREFLANQARDLEYLGRSASDRLSEHADRLQGLIVENGSQVDAIAGTSKSALENMERLKDSLPVVANSCRDVSNQIGSAGRTAQDQLSGLIAGFERLNSFGEASERQVASLRGRVTDALQALADQARTLEDLTAERFATLRSISDAVRDDLQAQEIEALAALQARSIALRTQLAEAHAEAGEEETSALARLQDRINALRDEAAGVSETVRAGEQTALGAWRGQVDAMRTRLEQAVSEIQEIDAAALDAANAKLHALLEEADRIDTRIAERNRLFDEQSADRVAALTEHQDEAAKALDAQMKALDDAILQRRDAQRVQLEAMTRDGEELARRIGALSDVFNSVAAQGHEARETIAGGIHALVDQLGESRDALDGTEHDVSRLTDASVRLLELLQASAKQSGEALPLSMQASEERLADIERRASEVTGLLDQARQKGDSLNERLDEVDQRTRVVMTGFDDFHQEFDGNATRQLEEVEKLRHALIQLRGENEALSTQVKGELAEAIALLEERAKNALSALETDHAGRITSLAESIGARSAQEIDRALADKTADAFSQLDEARARSSEAAREMTQDLRDQLGRLNELTVNLESRIAHARDKASDRIDGDFARRVALIAESLNSSSIDIAKALSSDVTDTAWASYLRGDRGIFTRRTVRLLDNTQARQIAEIYDADPDFRDHVNRYIHDFEAMLRTLLSTRDGNAVSVTLLSSDMGKLYVALAQALERLRQ